MKIDYAGKLWSFELEEMTVAQCEAVEKYVGKGLGEWSNQLAAGAVKAITALWWVMRKQSGDSPGPISEPGEDFRPVKLLSALNTAIKAEQAEEEAAAAAVEAAPDPTGRPSASSPEPRGTPATPASDTLSPSRPG